jgi:hypothetical protein
MASACVSAPGDGSISCESGDELFSAMQFRASSKRWRVRWRFCEQETYRLPIRCNLNSSHSVGNRSDVKHKPKRGRYGWDWLHLPLQATVTPEPEIGRSA